MQQRSENEEDEHQNSWADGGRGSEDTYHTELCNVNAGKELLQSPRVDETTGVDLSVCDKENVVSPCEIEY
ncbi:hypothetical protein RRF57_009562 [Xylaria bambusicola]|uniref:Uncharacterized protein n=1 Tax=Xylaria bambusicola TaxID=326684 RepID=A0AAN7ZC10_9PEZI